MKKSGLFILAITVGASSAAMAAGPIEATRGTTEARVETRALELPAEAAAMRAGIDAVSKVDGALGKQMQARLLDAAMNKGLAGIGGVDSAVSSLSSIFTLNAGQIAKIQDAFVAGYNAGLAKQEQVAAKLDTSVNTAEGNAGSSNSAYAALQETAADVAPSALSAPVVATTSQERVANAAAHDALQALNATNALAFGEKTDLIAAVTEQSDMLNDIGFAPALAKMAQATQAEVAAGIAYAASTGYDQAALDKVQQCAVVNAASKLQAANGITGAKNAQQAIDTGTACGTGLMGDASANASTLSTCLAGRQ